MIIEKRPKNVCMCMVVCGSVWTWHGVGWFAVMQDTVVFVTFVTFVTFSLYKPTLFNDSGVFLFVIAYLKNVANEHDLYI